MVNNILSELSGHKAIALNNPIEFDLGNNYQINIYPRSIFEKDKCLFFIGKDNLEKYLFISFVESENKLCKIFDGLILSGTGMKKCPLTTNNRKSLQSIFNFTVPKPLGVLNSIGMGDRIGLAGPGHIRALEGSNFKPILAQQSIRELTRTNRSADEVMDAAVWAVFQEGYTGGFGADADHLKTTESIDMMVKAGFTMFTFDPGDHVDNSADTYSEDILKEKAAKLPWDDLQDSLEAVAGRYNIDKIYISDSLTMNINFDSVFRAYVKYGNAVAYIYKMFRHLKDNYASHDFEIEVSVDETDSVTSPFDHFFIVNELKRLGVEFVSLAPRFVGSFEKGIDYKGDLELFKTEYRKHLAIVDYFGNYKISLHSGSDKFSVYEVIGSMKNNFTHIKTAGTSYLEALKVVAAHDTGLFREILNFACGLYETEKKSYYVTADIKNVKDAWQYNDYELLELFNSLDVRQILHVTFGRVLTEKAENGKFLFKERIINCLRENEQFHYEDLISHFKKHLKPFMIND